MTHVTALLKEASKLDLSERVELVSSLLEDLDPEPHWASDEEAIARLEELSPAKYKAFLRKIFGRPAGDN